VRLRVSNDGEGEANAGRWQIEGNTLNREWKREAVIFQFQIAGCNRSLDVE